MTNFFNIDLDRNNANYQPLTPISFLDRAADVFPNHTAIIHGSLTYNYKEFFSRSKKLASALTKKNIVRGNTVSALLLNTPAMLEAHYGIPMCGSVLHAINTRLDADVIALSILSGAHMTIFTKVTDLLKSEKIDNILVTGGGIIPEEDMLELSKIGVGKLFSPGSSIQESINYITTWVQKNR